MQDHALPARGIAAHRGGAAAAPENTLAAFREAIRLGAHQIELDVRRTSDAALVVVHDERVDRTTDGRGRVAQLDLAALRRLDAGAWMGAAYAGERVPTLEEALAVMPRDVWINVQIKRGEPIAEEVARVLVESGRLEQAFVSCGNAAAEAARRVHPGLLICNLVRQRTRAAYVEHAIATGASFVQLHHLRGPAEPELVERAKRAGLRVNYFCGPGDGGLEALFAAGVDFALVDDVAAALERVRPLGIAPLRR